MDQVEIHIIGNRLVDFVDGTESVLDITDIVYDWNGRPILLVTELGNIYNWNSVIRIRRTR